jgi:cardiolipin synthase
MMNRLPIQLVPVADYFALLKAQIPKAKQRIIIHAMEVSWGPETSKLAPLLIEAAGRGVEVRLVGDVYSKYIARAPRLSRGKTVPWKHTQAINEQLRASGAHITYVGKLGINPFKRRCHSKITILDDLVFSFGGSNFSDDFLNNRDYMLELHNAPLADQLDDLVGEIERADTTPLSDRRVELDPYSSLLFDGGTPGRSVIYETACDVVATARKIYYVSQMCPSGKLAELITQTENECYFIRPAQAEPPSHIDLIWNKLRYRIVNRYTGKAYVHAKFILAEDHDGSKHVVSGSNNFSWRGVRYGTKEIALHSTDPELWDSFYAFLREKIAGKRG